LATGRVDDREVGEFVNLLLIAAFIGEIARRIVPRRRSGQAA